MILVILFVGKEGINMWYYGDYGSTYAEWDEEDEF
jgi:hypothetical protein